jgi:hypothetical protein
MKLMETDFAVVWRNADSDPPPEGVVVLTMSPGGIQQKLKRCGRLWFVEDGTMYVYYTPQFWLPIA